MASSNRRPWLLPSRGVRDGTSGWAAAAVAGTIGVGFTLGANSAADEVASARAGSPNPDSACFGASSSAGCAARAEADGDRVHDTNLAVGSFIGAGALLVVGTVAFFAWPGSRSGSSRGSARSIGPIFGKQGNGLEPRQEF